MFVATAIVTAMLAAMLTTSAVLKLTHSARIVEFYAAVGVPEGRLNQLAAILLAGAGGLVAGLFWPPIGIAAAIGVIGYFTVAIAFHLRAADVKGLPTPVFYLATAVAALVLRLASL